MAEKEQLTPEEYAEQFVYYGDFGGIDVETPEVDEPDGPDEPITSERPDILTPVSDRDEQNIFSAQPISGTYKSSYSTQKPEDYIKNFDAEMASTTDKSKGGFDKYLEQAGGALGAAVTPAFGFPVGALGYGMGQLAKKQHRKNAASIIAAGGNSGSMFKFNGQTVSRAPGSKIYTGNLGGMSQGDMYRYEEISRGFIPGTMREISQVGAGPQGMQQRMQGLSGVANVSVDGAIMDAFGTSHSAQRNEGGHMMISAGQAQRMREQEFRNMAAANNISLAGMSPSDFTMAAVAFKQEVDANMKGQPYYGGFFHKTSNMTAAQNIQALKDRTNFGNTAMANIRDKYGLGTTKPDEPETPPPPPPPPPSSGGGSDNNQPPPSYSPVDRPSYTDDSGYQTDPGGGGSYSGNSYDVNYDSSQDTSFEGAYEDDDMYARGGRVGMQAGGVATQPAGFVGGPPENFTDGQTVADDQPMSVPEGTFVINAAAVEFAGSDDIKKMLSDAYRKMQKKVDKSIRVAKIPTEDEIDVAVSRGEVIVPPEVAKIIGYDRLEKINNRGKKEVSRRQKAAEGGFLGAGGYAEGGDVGEDIPMEESIVLDDSTRQKFSTFLKSRRQRGDVEKLIDSLDDRERLFVLGLVETTAAKDSVDSMMGVMQTAINRANTDRPSFKSVNDLSSVMKQRSSRGSGSRMFQYDGLEPSKITPRLREVVQGRVPNAVTKLFMAAENLTNPETEGQRPLPFDVMFYTKPDAPLAKDFEKNPKMRYHSSFGGHDYYALDAAPEN